MMICPQCNTSYSDEFLYCLADGAPLVDEAETPTVVRAYRHGGAAEVACPSCGLPNTLGSTFCKRCGSHLQPYGFAVPTAPPPAAPVPDPIAYGSAPTRSSPLPYVLIGVGALLLAGVAAVIAYNYGAGSAANVNVNTNTNKSNSSGGTTPTRTPTPTPTATQDSNSVSSSLVGKTGTLTTDVNLRDSPDRTSSKVGTHYQGARVRVVDTAEAPNDEGTLSTWYRIEVTSYGTSLDPNNYGQGKDPGSLDEGWINSEPKVYDPVKKTQVRKRTVNFDQP